ncbi:MAG: four helix bundle protein [Deltaproteobacteria bacterium]|nr:four helix bundle protein [Deltaproteobacteria bacterium]
MTGRNEGSKISRFEDLIAWQKSRALTKAIYQTTNSKEFSGDFGLKDQMRRSAVSTMSNIAEGFERGSRAEFHKFLVIAKGSCGELRSQLYVALDAGYINSLLFDKLTALALETNRIIGGLRSAVYKQKTA